MKREKITVVLDKAESKRLFKKMQHESAMIDKALQIKYSMDNNKKEELIDEKHLWDKINTQIIKQAGD